MMWLIGRGGRWTGAAVVALTVLALLGSAANVMVAERDRSALVAAVGELRTTSTTYVDQVLLESAGLPADPDGVGEEITTTVMVFLEGGEVEVAQGSAHNTRTVDAASDEGVLRRLQHQKELAELLVAAGDEVRALEPGSPAWGEAVQTMRTQDALLRSVVGDTAAEMARISRTALDRQLLMVGLGGLVLVLGGSLVLGSARVEARAEQSARYEALVQRSSDWVAVLDRRMRITYSTPAGPSLFDRDDGLEGTDILTLLDDDGAVTLAAAVRECRAESANSGNATAGRVEVVALTPDGPRRLAVLVTDLTAVTGVAGVVINARDITEQARLHDALEDKAYRDDLTGLANRAMLSEHLERAMARSSRSDEPLGLVYLDLDDFKAVNDAYGHTVGDGLLRQVGQRLLEVTRPADIVARLGGDEFALLLADGAEPDGTYALVQRIEEALTSPFVLSTGVSVRMSASIGIRTSTPEDDSPEAFLRDADVAMYAAKSEAKGTSRIFDAGMHASVLERHGLAQDLRVALPEGQMWLAYQPKVLASDGTIVGVEALLRWQHPVRGSVSPAQFIPVAEDSGFIVELGRWVLEESARTAALLASVPGLEHVSVSVNVATRQLLTPGFVQIAREALTAAGADPANLMLEVTESALQGDHDRAAGVLAELRGIGFRVSIDDFGTGYSSLHRLRTLPIDELKIDRSFIVDAVEANPQAVALLRTIASLGREFGLSVVAEGVEDDAQLTIARTNGVDLIQGYLFDRPLPYDELVSRWGGVTADRAASVAARPGTA